MKFIFAFIAFLLSAPLVAQPLMLVTEAEAKASMDARRTSHATINPATWCS